jgi:hypothetical protein
MTHKIHADESSKSSVINTEIPPRPQKGTWLAFGVKSICTLTGVAIGAIGGRYVAAIYAIKILARSNNVELAVSLSNRVDCATALSAAAGAVTGNRTSNRILGKTGL